MSRAANWASADLGELFGQADTLTRLGDTRAAAEDLPTALDAWQLALDILADLHHPDADQVRAKLHQHHHSADHPLTREVDTSCLPA